MCILILASIIRGYRSVSKDAKGLVSLYDMTPQWWNTTQIETLGFRILETMMLI